MNTYRFSGTMPEVGFVQIDIEEENVSKAKAYLIENYNDFKTFGVTKL